MSPPFHILSKPILSRYQSRSQMFTTAVASALKEGRRGLLLKAKPWLLLVVCGTEDGEPEFVPLVEGADWEPRTAACHQPSQDKTLVDQQCVSPSLPSSLSPQHLPPSTNGSEPERRSYCQGSQDPVGGDTVGD
ncbi:unnamed protein product [Pleuronectes platessa]|uniref:Uncharacterized protein n=1 Tax=Pleuronectes platessa TaxID=8262 RepID=A0A9N7VB01_PLEPL|nr:unnamed protein product [Pleuronectes platessa]